jgi:hypothetical protein
LATPTQSFENHARFVPLYHYVTSPLILVALVWSVVRLAQAPSTDRLLVALLALGLALAAYWARAFALGVQDRLIRLEERLRMDRVLTGELRARIGDFTTEQLIGLRFASDEELEELAGRVLSEGISDRKAVKALVTSWRADHHRI